MEENKKVVRVSLDLRHVVDTVYACAHAAALRGDISDVSLAGIGERETLLTVCRNVLAGAAFVMAPALTDTNVNDRADDAPDGTYSGPVVVTFDIAVADGADVAQVYSVLHTLAVAGLLAAVTPAEASAAAVDAHAAALERLRRITSTLRLGLPSTLRPAI